jgi:hypothetical protein
MGYPRLSTLLVTFLIEIDKLFQSFIALYEKLLVLHKFAFGVIKLPDRVSQLRINHVFNIYHSRVPEYLSENFNINQGNRSGASNLNFITPNANLCSTNSFSYNAIKDWSSLPISIKNVTDKEAFKNAVIL